MRSKVPSELRASGICIIIVSMVLLGMMGIYILSEFPFFRVSPGVVEAAGKLVLQCAEVGHIDEEGEVGRGGGSDGHAHEPGRVGLRHVPQQRSAKSQEALLLVLVIHDQVLEFLFSYLFQKASPALLLRFSLHLGVLPFHL